MKKVNTLYWIFTSLLILLMAFSAIGSFIPNPQGAAMLKQLGYQPYIIHFLSVAKILGIIAILTPGVRRLKEWAYAGFTFDLLGAIFSFIATGFPFFGMGNDHFRFNIYCRILYLLASETKIARTRVLNLFKLSLRIFLTAESFENTNRDHRSFFVISVSL